MNSRYDDGLTRLWSRPPPLSPPLFSPFSAWSAAPRGRFHHQAVAWNGSMIVQGGFNGRVVGDVLVRQWSSPVLSLLSTFFLPLHDHLSFSVCCWICLLLSVFFCQSMPFPATFRPFFSTLPYASHQKEKKTPSTEKKEFKELYAEFGVSTESCHCQPTPLPSVSLPPKALHTACDFLRCTVAQHVYCLARLHSLHLPSGLHDGNPCLDDFHSCHQHLFLDRCPYATRPNHDATRGTHTAHMRPKQ